MASGGQRHLSLAQEKAARTRGDHGQACTGLSAELKERSSGRDRTPRGSRGLRQGAGACDTCRVSECGFPEAHGCTVCGLDKGPPVGYTDLVAGEVIASRDGAPRGPERECGIVTFKGQTEETGTRRARSVVPEESKGCFKTSQQCKIVRHKWSEGRAREGRGLQRRWSGIGPGTLSVRCWLKSWSQWD